MYLLTLLKNLQPNIVLFDICRSYELDKIRRHKMEAAEDIERYKKEKLQRLQAKEEEKKRVCFFIYS